MYNKQKSRQIGSKQQFDIVFFLIQNIYTVFMKPSPEIILKLIRWHSWVKGRLRGIVHYISGSWIVSVTLGVRTLSESSRLSKLVTGITIRGIVTRGWPRSTSFFQLHSTILISPTICYRYLQKKNNEKKVKKNLKLKHQ